MTRPVRMSDVAKLAGVGTMTVSRVLNGTANVSEETRGRVVNAIAKLKYLPNEVARSLREQRSRQIGIIVPNLYDPFFAVCAHSITQIARRHSYSTIIATSDDDPLTECLEAQRMLRRNVEGLIVIPALGKSELRDPEFERIPIVTLDRLIVRSPFDSVVVQNREGTRIGVEHLLEHRHRRIIFLDHSLQPWTNRERREGYRLAMKKAGLNAECHIVAVSQEETVEPLRKILGGKRPPTALFCCNNLVTRYILHALSKLNVRVPEDIALVGFDDFEMADIIKPAITVVRQPTNAMGRVAAELMFSRLTAGKSTGRAKHIVLPVELIVRNSCGAH